MYEDAASLHIPGANAAGRISRTVIEGVEVTGFVLRFGDGSALTCKIDENNLVIEPHEKIVEPEAELWHSARSVNGRYDRVVVSATELDPRQVNR